MATYPGEERCGMAVSTEELEDVLTGFTLLGCDNDGNQTPEDVLRRMLSTETAVSKSSSDTERCHRARELTHLQNFAPIGGGACGEVFQQSGAGITQISKRARSEIYALQLRNDYDTHARVQEAFDNRRASLKMELRVPRLISFVGEDDGRDWWIKHGSKFPVESIERPKSALLAERIFPVHKEIRTNLIRKYCEEGHRKDALQDPKNADALMRVYLGAKRPQQRYSRLQGFTLRNFKFYLDDMEELGLDPAEYATAMAQSLALMHWEVKCDARDVEFVLGSSRSTDDEVPEIPAQELELLAPCTSIQAARLNLKRRIVQLWLIDFNQVAIISMDQEGVDAAVKAFMINDPYYPRPPTHGSHSPELWSTFKDAYLETSDRIMRLQEAEDKIVEWKGLPEAFIESLVEAEKKRSENKAKRSRD